MQRRTEHRAQHFLSKVSGHMEMDIQGWQMVCQKTRYRKILVEYHGFALSFLERSGVSNFSFRGDISESRI